MRLIIETGEGLENANSYIDLVDVEKYLPSSVLVKLNELSVDEQIDRFITASLFIDFSFDWIGQQKTLEQGLSWPRINVLYQGHKIPENYIPTQIKKACSMAINLIMKSGIGVFQETNEAQIKKEKFGPIETEYFKAMKYNFDNSSQFSDINNLLRGLFKKQNSGVITAEVLLR